MKLTPKRNHWTLLWVLVSIFFIQSCKLKPISNSEEKIVNGNYVEITSKNKINSTVQVITVLPGTTEGSMCGGTIVSDNTVVTAAHCIDEYITQPSVRGKLQSCVSNASYNNVCSTSIHPHPAYKPSLDPKESGYVSFDVAYIVFKRGTFKHYASLPTKPNAVKKNSKVFLVGYSDFFPGAGFNEKLTPKRWGEANIKALQLDHLIHLSRKDLNREITLSPGDSGGPMFDNQCNLVGVASFIDLSDKDLNNVSKYLRSWHMNLTSPSLYSWLQKENGKNDSFFCGISNDAGRCEPNAKSIFNAALGANEFPCASSKEFPANVTTNTNQNLKIAIVKNQSDATKFNFIIASSLESKDLMFCQEKISAEECKASPNKRVLKPLAKNSKTAMFSSEITLTKQKEEIFRLISVDNSQKVISTRLINLKLK